MGETIGMGLSDKSGCRGGVGGEVPLLERVFDEGVEIPEMFLDSGGV